MSKKKPSDAQINAIKTYEDYYSVIIHAETSYDAWKVISEFCNNGRELKFTDGIIEGTGVKYTGSVDTANKLRTDTQSTDTTLFLHNLSKSMKSEGIHNSYDMLPDNFDFSTNNPHDIVE